MPYLKFPIIFAKDEDEKYLSMGITPPKGKEPEPDDIYINTACICAFNEMDNGNVLVRMSNGEAYEMPIDIEDFNDILNDLIVELPMLSTN